MTPQEYQDARDSVIVAETRYEKLLKANSEPESLQFAKSLLHQAIAASATLLESATSDERRAASVEMTRDGNSNEWATINE